MSPRKAARSEEYGSRRGWLLAEVVDRRRGRTPRVQGLEAFLRRLGESKPPRPRSRVVVCLVSDEAMRRLNRTYRGRRGTTDVLAFPGGGARDPEGRVHLGDIAVSVPRAARQAMERGHSLGREIKILALHGYLHLLGLDHEKDRGEMLRAQDRLARALVHRGPRRTA